MQMAAELTPLAVKLLEALRQYDGWMTRAEIARGIGRQSGVLQEYDRVLLEQLSAAGLIEMSTRPRGVASVVNIYRAVK